MDNFPISPHFSPILVSGLVRREVEYSVDDGCENRRHDSCYVPLERPLAPAIGFGWIRFPIQRSGAIGLSCSRWPDLCRVADALCLEPGAISEIVVLDSNVIWRIRYFEFSHIIACSARRCRVARSNKLPSSQRGWRGRQIAQ
jgi:hypothetical protein